MRVGGGVCWCSVGEGRWVGERWSRGEAIRWCGGGEKDGWFVRRGGDGCVRGGGIVVGEHVGGRSSCIWRRWGVWRCRFGRRRVKLRVWVVAMGANQI